MVVETPEPALASDAPDEGCSDGCCPHCGAVGEAIPDPTAEHMAMLMELAQIGMRIALVVERKVDATGEATAADKDIYNSISRSVRQTLAVRQAFYDGSKKTSAQRHAEALRRIEAQERARFQVRRATMQRAVERVIEAEVERRGVPSDRENLLSDMHERLLDVDIERAETPMQISAIVLGICKQLGITPPNQTWSDALMAYETHRTYEAVRDAEASRVPPEGVAVTVPVPEPQGPGEEVKIGSVTFNPDGSFKCRDFDPPQEDWPDDIVNRPPIDLLAMRQKGRPPDTG